MRIIFVAPALLFAGLAVAQSADRPDPRDPRAKAPRAEYRSAFEGYRPFAEPEAHDWRKSNEEVAKPSTGKPQPEKPAAPGHEGHRK